MSKLENKNREIDQHPFLEKLQAHIKSVVLRDSMRNNRIVVYPKKQCIRGLNSIELVYQINTQTLYDNVYAVQRFKLGYKRAIPFNETFYFRLGTGFSLEDNVQNRFQDAAFDYNLDLHGDLLFSAELRCKNKNVGLYVGGDLGYMLYSRYSTISLIPDSVFGTRIANNKFETLNRWGYALNYGIEYELPKNWMVGLGLYRRLNSHIQTDQISSPVDEVSKIEFRLTKHI